MARGEDLLQLARELRGTQDLPDLSMPDSAVQRAIEGPLAAWGGTLVETAVLKTGRTHSIAVCVDPLRPVSAAEVDALSRDLKRALEDALGPAMVVTVVTAEGYGP